MRDSGKEELRQWLAAPSRPPARFGFMRVWWDESPHSFVASLIVFVLAVILTLSYRSLGGGNSPEAPAVGLEQLVLGEGDEDLNEAANVDDATVKELEKPKNRSPDEITPAKVEERGDITVKDPPIATGGNPGQQAKNQDALAKILSQTRPGGGGLVGIFKIPTSYKSVVFVIDKSSSMADERRLQRVKAELLAGITALGEHQRFSVFFFDDLTWPFLSNRGVAVSALTSRPTLFQADSKTKAQARQWIGQISSWGGTNPFPAVMLALQAKPQLIMLLSDGEFNPFYVQQITQQNKLQGGETRIDCVGLGEDVLTLKQIAKQNRGVYYPAR